MVMFEYIEEGRVMRIGTLRVVSMVNTRRRAVRNVTTLARSGNRRREFDVSIVKI